MTDVAVQMRTAPVAGAPRRPRCLSVRPASTGSVNGGDEVVYRKSFAFLARDLDLEILELQPVGKLQQVLKLTTMTPPECTRFMSRANAQALSTKLASAPYDIVVLFNEVSFPFLAQVKQAKLPAVLVAQNVHSLVARTDPSPIARAMRPLALAFERRLYADPAAGLVLISEVDRRALLDAGVRRTDVHISPAGAPPSTPLAADAPVLGEAVLTGSYSWWRKRRDVRTFAEGAPLGIPIQASDPVAREILGDEGAPLDESEAGFWSAGLRFGLITDVFVGGFKLKSLEYVAKNAVVLCFSDISLEFEGLPHAAEFVRFVRSKDEAGSVIASMRAEDPHALIGRFLAFKAACLERYAWDRCLAPLRDAIAERLDRR